MVTVVLASASPRRKALLQQLGLHPQVMPADIDEAVRPQEAARDYVLRMAKEKAEAVVSRYTGNAVVIGADTAVICDDEIMGKPENKAAATAMLRQLSGRSHWVMSSVALMNNGEISSRLNETQVSFRLIFENEIEAYWRSGEPADKAGAYAIQGLAAMFISRLEGSYSAVMGLPLFETAQLLRQAGVELLES